MKKILGFTFMLMLIAVSCFAEDIAPVATATDTGTVITIVLGALLAISEVLALIPSIKSNSIFQLVVNILKGASNK